MPYEAQETFGHHLEGTKNANTTVKQMLSTTCELQMPQFPMFFYVWIMQITFKLDCTPREVVDNYMPNKMIQQSPLIRYLYREFDDNAWKNSCLITQFKYMFG